tara:strand:- start:84 stop:236 length:153 start_codon:yes stop_codon:yes gene_type:complete
MITSQLAIVLAYRAFLVGALMYTVGYLNWSAWWLLLLLTMVTLNDKEKNT